ncbi:MAG: hypothetical protein M3N07_08645 [Pseudomonadota bacterium]|nr:hypothetical protein [Pseudomonadota bacterium]
MFVSTEDGEIPLSRITSAVIRRDAVTIVYAGDEETRATPTAWEMALRDTPIQMTPAEPGTYLLHPDMVDGEFVVFRSKVVAWSMSADRIVYPVTAQGVNDGVQDTCPILHPDGAVDVYDDRTYETYDAWAAAAEVTLRKREPRRIVV